MGDLRFRSIDLQSGGRDSLTGGIWFDLETGYFEPAEVRGEDDTVPEAAGMAVGPRIRHRRIITLVGHVRGSGATFEERSSSWYTYTQSLMAVMQLHSTPGLLEVDGDYLGIPSGEVHSLNARCIRAIPGPIQNRMAFQPWSFQLLCIDSPPEWSVTPS